MENSFIVTYKEIWGGISITNNFNKAIKNSGWVVANNNTETVHNFKDLRLTKYEVKALIELFQQIEKTMVIEAL